MEHKAITTEDIARELGVSRSMVRYLVARGRITPVDRAAKSWLFATGWREEYERTRPKLGRRVGSKDSKPRGKK